MLDVFQFGYFRLYIFIMLTLFHGQSETLGCSCRSWDLCVDTFRYLQGKYSMTAGYLSSCCGLLGPSHSRRSLESFSADRMSKTNIDCTD